MTTTRLKRTGSMGSQSDDGSHSGHCLEPPVLVYHESARSIVFRDHLRRAVVAKEEEEQTTPLPEFSAPLPHKPLVVTESPAVVDQMETLGTIVNEQLDPEETVRPSEAGIPSTQIGGFTPQLQPLAPLDFGPDDTFQALLLAQPPPDFSSPDDDMTAAETQVVEWLGQQACAVKTIQNNEWGAFLHRFTCPEPKRGRAPNEHDDIGPDDHVVNDALPSHTTQFHPYNSFVTSTTLLPPYGKKMRCFGSTSQYTVGVVFGLPEDYGTDETEDEAAARTQTWSWPAGYSAKTEFNIDGRGRLINGRQEALVPLSVLREYNQDYLTEDSYVIGTRFVENAGLNQIPYNEVYLRVGGVGRLVDGVDVASGAAATRSLDRGVGLPVALFVRTASYGNLITMLRVRARMMHVLGENHFKRIPLLLITPDLGVRVLTESLQKDLWKIAAQNLNPFQNQSIAYKTTVDHTDETSFQQKVDELIDLDETIKGVLTPKELARIAGGFGATDDSVAGILRQAMVQDKRINNEQGDDASGRPSHKLQDVVNEGLASALRSGDYHTSRQLLILYSLVASRPDNSEQGEEEDEKKDPSDHGSSQERKPSQANPKIVKKLSSLGRDTESMKKDLGLIKSASGLDSLSSRLPAPPPPPPLDTDRLRSATNSDGLLAVLGAAQVLKAMQDGGARKRVHEVIDAVDEWVNYGEQSVAFRISSWYDQRAAQGDLKIAMENSSNFMAFVSNKAIANRKAFAQQLREAADATDFTDMSFLEALDAMLKKMHSPCLRLELLQYVLGLDNRYSVAHVARSVELAATCLDISLSGQ